MLDLTPLDREQHPEILRMFAKTVARRNEELERRIAEYEKKIAEIQQQKLTLDDTLHTLRKLFFGHGQERAKDEDRSRTKKEEEQFLLHAESFAPPPGESERKELPEQSLIYEMTDEALTEEAQVRGFEGATRADWEEIAGLYDVSREITVTERRYTTLIHRRKKYLYLPSKGTEKEVIVTASGSEKLLPGCHYSIDFALSVVRDKYGDHIPLERQVRRMEADGLAGVGVKTLYNLCAAVGVHHEGVAKGIRQDIFSSDRSVHADETPWRMYGKKDDSGYMWVISNQAGAFYQYEPTRSGKVIEEMLEGYKGPVLSDGYAGYNRLTKLDRLKVANCWAHARRKFWEIRENYPEECDDILTMIDELFAIERKAREWDELERLRREESAPLIERIRNWLYEMKPKHFPESGLVKAIDYALKLWPGLSLFLTDLCVPLSNNDAERAIRHSVMGRKNFYGSQTINGADLTATLYTVIESCKRVELEPIPYMRYVIRQNNRKEPALTPLAYARSIRQPLTT